MQTVTKGLGAKNVQHEEITAPEKAMMPHLSTSTWLRWLSVAAASKSFETRQRSNRMKTTPPAARDSKTPSAEALADVYRTPTGMTKI